MHAEPGTGHLTDTRTHFGSLLLAAAIATSFVAGAGATALLQGADLSRPASPAVRPIDDSYDRIESMRGAAPPPWTLPDRSQDDIEHLRGEWTGQ